MTRGRKRRWLSSSFAHRGKPRGFVAMRGLSKQRPRLRRAPVVGRRVRYALAREGQTFLNRNRPEQSPFHRS